MQYKGKEITEEMIKKAEACESVEELMSLAKEIGVELTNEEAEAFLNDSEDLELDAKTLDEAAGGSYGTTCPKYKGNNTRTGVIDKNRTDA